MAGNLNDFPELKKVFDKLMTEREEIEAKVKPLRTEYKKLQEQCAPMIQKMRALAKDWQAIERPRLIEIDQQLSAIARSTGGRSTSDK